MLSLKFRNSFLIGRIVSLLQRNLQVCPAPMQPNSLDRYFSESPLLAEPVAGVSPLVTISGSEAHHMANVMRARPGDEFELFDGRGSQFHARVTEVSRSKVELAILSEESVSRELPFFLAVAVALPKGDRQKWLIEKLVELGVTKVIPVVTQRSVAQPSAKALERLRRGVVEASKQCRRNRLMEIVEPTNWSEFVSQASSGRGLYFVAHPYETSHPGELPAESSDATIAVGPEGGFSEAEISQALKHGWQSLQFGPRVLRVETAAIALVAALIS